LISIFKFIAKNLRSTFVVLIAMVPGLCAFGQVKFTTMVSSREVGLKEYFQVEFVVENATQIDALTPPNIPMFHVVEGPMQSSGMSVINGITSQYKGLSFMLQPSKTGKFTIVGATAMVDGKQMQSNSVTITVHAGGSAPANPGGGGGGGGGLNSMIQPFGPDPFEPEPVEREEVLRPGENVKEKIRRNIFVKLQVDRNTCYVGEPIVATYKLYSKLKADSRVTKRPSLNGFSVYDMIDPGSAAASVEKLNGRAYDVRIIRKTQLIPLQPGNIDLDPVEVENTVHFVQGGVRHEPHHSGNHFQDLLNQLNSDNNSGPEIDEIVTLDTKPVTIKVKPLPEAKKPEGFNGAVGNFSVEASLANKDIAAQDEATLHVVVKGKGNLPVINAPSVPWPSGIDALDPTSKEEVNKTVVPMSGSKSFDYVFTARAPGHYTIPAINFSYFDPGSQTYKMTGTGPLDLQVMPPAKNTKHVDGNEALELSVSERLLHFTRNHLEWLFAVVLLLLVIVYFWRQNKRLKKDQNATPHGATANAATPQGATAQNAPVQIRPGVPDMSAIAATAYLPAIETPDPLLEARQYFDRGDYKAFYREVNRAVWKSISKKLELPSSELNKQNCIRQLQLRGWDTASILSLENMLNECELNLYTPAYDTYNMQQLLRQAEWMLDRLA
jgi:hypothetical protein